MAKGFFSPCFYRKSGLFSVWNWKINSFGVSINYLFYLCINDFDKFSSFSANIIYSIQTKFDYTCTVMIFFISCTESGYESFSEIRTIIDLQQIVLTGFLYSIKWNSGSTMHNKWNRRYFGNCLEERKVNLWVRSRP